MDESIRETLEAINKAGARQREVLGMKLVFQLTALHPNADSLCQSCGVSWPCPTIQSIEEVVNGG